MDARKMAVHVINHPAEIQDVKIRAQVLSALHHGKPVESFYQKPEAGQPPQLTVIAPAVRTPRRAAEAVLHEMVGHLGLEALFAKNPSGWYRLTEQLWNQLRTARFSPPEARHLGYHSLQELARSYHHPGEGQDYNSATVRGRANLIEEHLARLAEGGLRPAWWPAVTGYLKKLLPKTTNGNLFQAISDDGLRHLLRRARQAARNAINSERS
jgi:hypothetical protein